MNQVRPGWGLRVRIVMAIVSFGLVLGASMAVLVNTVLQQRLFDTLKKRGVYAARQFANKSVDFVLTEDHYELALFLKESIADDETLAYVFIRDPHGRIPAHTFAGGFPADLAQGSGLGADGAPAFRRLLLGDDPVLDVAVPLAHGIDVGVLHLGMSERSIHSDVDELLKLMLAIIAVVMVLGVAGGAALGSKTVEPLLQLADVMEAVGKGETGRRCEIRTQDEIGRLGAIFNRMVDLRLRAEDGLRASESRLREIASSLGEGVLVLDERGMLLFMNPEAERLLGWTAHELLGKDVVRMVHHAGESPAPGSLIAGVRETSEGEWFQRKDGTRFPVSSVTAPLRRDGKEGGVVMAFQDVTARVKATAERENLIAELQEALENIRTLKRLLPICASCKKIRDDAGYWHQVEDYMWKHGEMKFSHGLCPGCVTKLYPDLVADGGAPPTDAHAERTAAVPGDGRVDTEVDDEKLGEPQAVPVLGTGENPSLAPETNAGKKLG